MKKLYSIIFIVFMAACASNNASDKPNLNETAIDQGSYYQEQYRPQFHFSPEANWMNDPNGMVYYEGEYHLFYQYYPDATVWGPMHWGHAVSTDLVHWEHLPIALYPDDLGYIFSGSAVVDWNNTSGFGEGTVPPMVAIYTYHDPVAADQGEIDYQTQGIAYSADKGRTWTKYEDNPVLENPGIIDFRDPKVSWNDTYKKWVMTLAVKDHISFYSSPDLKKWQFESDFGADLGAHGGVWECPDLFEMTTQDGQKKSVLLVSINPGGPHGGSATQYFVGRFDGNKFETETTETFWLDYGKDNYAGVTWSDVPKSDGRRLFLGWMSNWQYANIVPTEKWRSAMTVSRRLDLLKTETGYLVASNPVKELDVVRQESYQLEQRNVNGEFNLSNEISFTSNLLDIEMELEIKNGVQEVGFQFISPEKDILRVGYLVNERNYYVDRTLAGKKDFSNEFPGIHSAQRKQKNGNLKLRILLDESSVELFADDGKTVITDLIFPNSPFEQVKMYSKGGETLVHSGIVHDMNSIWEGKNL